MKRKSIIITGPTASGKSDFAHELARQINGAIINCDSVQIYAGIENISASPFTNEKDAKSQQIDGVPYKLFSILSLNSHISVSEYLKLAQTAIDDVITMNKIPIFVGGTGYYINILLNGISTIPEISKENRMRARDMAQNDIEGARKILPTDFTMQDPQRIARALEVFFETGIHLTDWQKNPRSGALIPDAFKILILPPHEILLERIAKRIPNMIHGGALDEAKNIIANGFDETRAIGATQLCKMLRGEIAEKDAVEKWIIKTNQYAKRQKTWFRGQYNADLIIDHIPNEKDLNNTVNLLQK